MPSDKTTNVLYIGRNVEFVRSISKLLRYHRSDYKLEKVGNLREIQNTLQRDKFHAFLFDAHLLKNNDHYFFDRIMGFAKQIPIVVVVDKDQEDIGIKALEKGAFDYVVRVEGALTAIPFTLDRARRLNASSENINFDFEVKPVITEGSAFFEINESGRFMSFDENLANILGLSSNEFYKSYLMDFIADEDREKFYLWRTSMKNRRESFMVTTEVIHRERGIIPVELQLSRLSRPEEMISGFRGYLKVLKEGKIDLPEQIAPDLKPFFFDMYRLNQFLRQNLTQLFFMKVTELPKKYFRFSHAALFLYHPIKHSYQKELEIGAGISEEKVDLRSDHFTEDEIKKLFPNSEFTRFVHQSVLSDEERKAKSGLFQEKYWKEGESWEIGDRLFLNLRTSDEQCLGFIVLESPESGKIPSAQVLERSEIFSNFASSIFESRDRYTKLEMKHKHFKQIFTILETFSIDLPLENLLREIVWTIKLSLGFNLPILAIFSKSTRRLNLKAIALENRNKSRLLARLHFSVEDIAPLLKEEYRISHSYLVTKRRSPLSIIKRVYGLPLNSTNDSRYWQYEDTLLVPIATKQKKIIGFLILDDPANKHRPYLELVQILEKIARLVSVTIDNKLIYTKLKSSFQRMQLQARSAEESNDDKNRTGRIKQVLKRMNLAG